MLFEVMTCPVYRCDDGMREDSWTSLFVAEDRVDAIRAVTRYAARVNGNLPTLYPPPEYHDPRVGCIKVYPLDVGPIDSNGYIVSPRGMAIFEWKCDWPSTLEEQVQDWLRRGTA